MIHESMHAGNFGDVGDEGVYIDRVAEFPLSPVSEKLKNAAHFEVAPRRLIDKDSASDPDDPYAYGGCKGCDPANPAQTFTPAGSAGPGGAATPPPTPRQQAFEEGVQDVQGGVDTGAQPPRRVRRRLQGAGRLGHARPLHALRRRARRDPLLPTCCRSGPRSTT